jgi:predicted GIY-YIG superfamily endonuclease
VSRRAPTGRPATEMGWVYTLHLLPPYPAYPAGAAPGQQQAKHYTGWTADLAARLTGHAEGKREAARLMQVQHEAGGTFILVSVERGTRDRETQLKERGASRRCPLCMVMRVTGIAL